MNAKVMTQTVSVEINRTEAAKILGVAVSTVKTYPIPFRQYKPKSKAMYKQEDVLAFKEKCMHEFKEAVS